MEQLTKHQVKINSFLLTGLKTLREGLTSLSLEQFVVNTLEVLILLERDEYFLTSAKILGSKINRVNYNALEIFKMVKPH